MANATSTEPGVRADRPRAAPPCVEARRDSRLAATPEELAVRAQGGSMPAFAELVDRFEARLFNFLLRRTPGAADAEDLTQEAFIRAWQRIGTYRPRWRFSTWLFTIASRLAVSHARKKSSRRPERLRDDRAEPAPDLCGEMDREAGRGRVWAVVAETVGAEQQAALWLRYVEGMAVKDIASVLGRTQVSVRVMLFRARAVLAMALSEERGLIAELKPTGEPVGAGDEP